MAIKMDVLTLLNRLPLGDSFNTANVNVGIYGMDVNMAGTV